MLRSLYRGAGYPEVEIERRIEGDLKEKPCELLCGRTPRYAMQTLGGDWGRGMIHPDFWINNWQARRDATPGHVVVDDVRYDNEALAVIEKKGLVYEVTRPNAEGPDNPTHASEQGIDPELVKEVVPNDRDQWWLHMQLNRIVYVNYRDPALD